VRLSFCLDEREFGFGCKVERPRCVIMRATSAKGVTGIVFPGSLRRLFFCQARTFICAYCHVCEIQLVRHNYNLFMKSIGQCCKRAWHNVIYIRSLCYTRITHLKPWLKKWKFTATASQLACNPCSESPIQVRGGR